jgi:phosphate starvation-inducible protein PhoH
MTTSFIRGLTIDNAVIIVDEMQNLNFHELDSVMTRVGNDCRIIFCGDYHQSDFREGSERDGVMKFIRILEQLKDFTVVQFGWDDIVRSDFVRDYIMTKEMLGIR